jgi:hypothetical protein
MRWSDYDHGAQVMAMAGYRITPVLVFWTGLPLNWVKFTFETGFELAPAHGPISLAMGQIEIEIF